MTAVKIRERSKTDMRNVVRAIAHRHVRALPCICGYALVSMTYMPLDSFVQAGLRGQLPGWNSTTMPHTYLLSDGLWQTSLLVRGFRCRRHASVGQMSFAFILCARTSSRTQRPITRRGDSQRSTRNPRCVGRSPIMRRGGFAVSARQLDHPLQFSSQPDDNTFTGTRRLVMAPETHIIRHDPLRRHVKQFSLAE
jgi:hypothetical protein